ncbi:LacI family DNA-binding transcriptional regulator [Cohnella sp. CFH 77786]|nr:LacI family DNA-binding transcriptional regulator [Cohnella sp. CFH 77786]
MNPVTVHDIAREANVSVATVPRELNQSAPGWPRTANGLCTAPSRIGKSDHGGIADKHGRPQGNRCILRERPRRLRRDQGGVKGGTARAGRFVDHRFRQRSGLGELHSGIDDGIVEMQRARTNGS